MSAICLPPIIIPKPKFREPCNGCGYCCSAVVCEIGKIAHGDVTAPCPSLDFIEGKYRCALVVAEEAFGLDRLLAQSLGIGKGCCSDDPQSQEDRAG